MAMEMSDFAVIKELIGDNKHGMSDYEEAMLAHKQCKMANATTTTALAFGIGAAVLGLTAWGFTQAKASGNKSLIDSNLAHAQQIEAMLAGQIAANRNTFEQAKAAQDTINITTTQSGTQSTSVSQSALAQAEATLLSSSLMGKVTTSPTEVVLTSKQYCPCPNSCNG